MPTLQLNLDDMEPLIDVLPFETAENCRDALRDARLAEVSGDDSYFLEMCKYIREILLSFKIIE